MRLLNLSKSGLQKLRASHTELKVSDFDDSLKSTSPGEWVFFKGDGDLWVGFVNPNIESRFNCAHALKKIDNEKSWEGAQSWISKTIKESLNRRQLFKDYDKNARVIYGASDNLPGLIVDLFENAAIIQINTAGLDKYRDYLKNEISEHLSVSAYLLDNEKYREKELLPSFEKPNLPDLKISENGLHYLVGSKVLQKIGFYYDHRENRLQLYHLIERLKIKPRKALDLFCYVGAWGMNALRGGAKFLTFVDQGDFNDEINKNLQANGFSFKGLFVRSDVFKFLDDSYGKKELFDLILCDPPAFAKSPTQKNQALEGYSKLHRKVFKILGHKSLVAFSSCTHYVSHEEFQKNILEAASKEKRKIQLIFTGLQGFDHPIKTQADKENYIKSYFYIVE